MYTCKNRMRGEKKIEKRREGRGGGNIKNHKTKKKNER